MEFLKELVRPIGPLPALHRDRDHRRDLRDRGGDGDGTGGTEVRSSKGSKPAIEVVK